MAGFEVVVRPVVLPNIRPQPAQSLPPVNDPEKGFCTIKGNPAQEVDTSNSWSRSTSKSHNVETERRSDEATVYQMDDDGKVNRDNFVKVKVANRIKSRGGKQPAIDGSGGDGQGIPGPGPYGYSHFDLSDYKRVEPAENVEIGNVDIVEKNPATSGE